MIDISETERRHAFSMWLRTGRWPVARGADGTELKFNPWHDPRDGRFTFANSGNYQGRGWGGGGFTGGGGGRTGGGGASGSWGVPEKPKPRMRVSRPATGQISRAPVAQTHLPAKPAKQAIAAPKIGARREPTTHHKETTAEPVRHVTRNGYDYEIDADGRTRKVSGDLDTAQTPLRSRTAQTRAGGNDRRPSDDGGHYIAARFNGPTDAFNHFAQDANFNRGDYRALEDQWAQEKKAGNSVFVKIVPAYEWKSQRPYKINVWFTINGHTESMRFLNESKKVRHGK